MPKDHEQFEKLNYRATFNRNYADAYALMRKRLRTAVELFLSRKSKQPLRVLDIGCGDGWVGETLITGTLLQSCRYYGFDSANSPLKRFADEVFPEVHRDFPGFESLLEQHDAFELLKKPFRNNIVKWLGGSPDLVVCNASGHQIRKAIASRGDLSPDEVLQIYKVAADMLSPGGELLIGDYFYRPSENPDDVRKTRQWIKDRTGQNPTMPDMFVQPLLSMSTLQDGGMTVDVDYAQANPEIVLQYYCITSIKGLA